jgi:hypothetical protein
VCVCPPQSATSKFLLKPEQNGRWCEGQLEGEGVEWDADDTMAMGPDDMWEDDMWGDEDEDWGESDAGDADGSD